MGNHSRRLVLRTGVFLAILLFLPVWQAGAAASRMVMLSEIGQPVTAGSSTTYADLLKLIFPDFAGAPVQEFEVLAHKTVPARHITDDHEVIALEGDIKFNLFVVLPIRSQGRDLLLLQVDPVATIELEDGSKRFKGYSLLALYENGSPPKLIDIMTDRFNGFWSKNPVVKLNAATDAFLVSNSHHNSNQQYTNVRMLFVNENRLQEICSIFTLNVKSYCNNYVSTLVFRTVPGRNDAYPPVVATIKLQREPSPRDCQPRRKGFTRKLPCEFRWDKKKQRYQQTPAHAAGLKWLDDFYNDKF